MTPGEFVERAVGIPWVRWRADWAAMDCFGLVVLYQREVLGVDLGAPLQAYLSTGHGGTKGWRECQPVPGSICFMAWQNGAPTHCAIMLPDGRMLHSEGTENTPGNVRITRLSAMQRAYGDLRFYTYTPPTC